MGGGKPGESNEEATWRMIGGKGKDKGKGGGKGGKSKKGDSGPPSSDEIPQRRRDELKSQLEEFAKSPEKQLPMPTTITGLERKYLHEVADNLGFTSQSFGQGRDRYLTIFKPDQQTSSSNNDVPDVVGAGTDDDAGNVSYSCCVLTEENQIRLEQFCRSKFEGGIPAQWTLHCEHMTICMGPLANPKTEDNRSVADAVRKQSAQLKVGQECELKVVSMGVGVGVDGNQRVMAVGVVGCVSCNKNPHITVATASKSAPPSLSNTIRQWNVLPVNEQIVLRSVVWQRGDKMEKNPTFAKRTLDTGPHVAAASTRLARAILKAETGGRPRTAMTLRELLRRRLGPNTFRLFAVHPRKLAQSLSDVLPAQDDIAQQLKLCLAAPAVDPLDVFGRPPNDVDADMVKHARANLLRLIKDGKMPERSCRSSPLSVDPVDPVDPVFVHKPSLCAQWLVSQACVPLPVNVDTLIEGLTKAAALKIRDDGLVEYMDLGSETKEDVVSKVGYLQPWPLVALVSKSS